MKLYTRVFLLSFILLIIFIPPGLAATTIVGQVISTSTTWTLSSSPYIVSGNVFVYSTTDPVLTIEAGVMVKFNSGISLTIGGISTTEKGGLKAIGTSSSQIIFTSSDTTSPSPGQWGAIQFQDYSDDTLSRLDNCIIEYGGSGLNTDIYVYGSSPVITNCVLRYSGGHGITGASDALPMISYCTFSENMDYPISLPAPAISNISNVACQENVKPGIENYGGIIGTSVTWFNWDVPYAMTGHTYVYGNATTANLTLGHGVMLKFNTDMRLQIGGLSATDKGTLLCNGDSTDRVYFTSLKDDSIGGDTNGDSTTSSPAPGNWDCIYFTQYGGNSNLLNYCTLQYGGKIYAGNIYSNTYSPTISNCSISYSYSCGIYGTSTAYPTITNCSFTYNNDYPISLNPDGIAKITGCTFSNNVKQGIEVRSGNMQVTGTWTNQGAPFIINSNVQVYKTAGTATLTLTPGVIIKFDTQGILNIGDGTAGNYGGLNAKGTTGNFIYFTSLKDDNIGGDTNGDTTATSPSPGDWETLYFADYSLTTSTLDYCLVRYGGYNYSGNIYTSNTTPTISHSTISNSISSGVYGVSGGYPTIHNCVFKYNGDYPISLKADGIGKIIDCSFSNNTHQAIEVLTDTIQSSATWVYMGVPYAITGNVLVYKTSGACTLTLNPNLILKFDSDCYLKIGSTTSTNQGGLIAQGTIIYPITFTSLKDDLHGGDTNADGNATSPAPGNWECIYFDQYTIPGSILDFCYIYYGGQNYNTAINCHYSSPVIQRCSITLSSHDGINSDYGSPFIRSNDISGNANNGIHCLGTNVPAEIKFNNITFNTVGLKLENPNIVTFTYNNISNNTTYGAQNTLTTVTHNGKRNWWGDTTGPYDPSPIGLYNPGGLGDNITDYIDYEPWLNQHPQQPYTLPAVKMLSGQSAPKVIALNLYCLDSLMYWDWLGDSNINQSLLNIDIDHNVDYMVTKSPSYIGRDTITFIGNDWAYATSIVKYSTYRINKLPQIALYAGTSIQLNIANYTNSTVASSGIIPTSYGNANSLINSDNSKILATWLNTSVLQITALSTFASASVVNLDVIAAPVSSGFGADIDKERIQIYPAISTTAFKFNNASDTSLFSFQIPSGATKLPTVSYISGIADPQSKNSDGGALKITFTSTTEGVKITPKFSTWLSNTPGTYYTLRVKVFGTNTANNYLQLLYNGNPGVSPTDVQGYFKYSMPTVWTTFDIPVNSFSPVSSARVMYPQIVLKSNVASGIVYIDEIQVFKATPPLVNTRYISTDPYSGGGWEDTTALSKWATQTISGYASTSVSGGQLFIKTSAASNVQSAVKFTASTASGTIYTIAANPGHQAGMRMQAKLLSGTTSLTLTQAQVNLLGTKGAGSFSQGGDIAAAAEIGRISDRTLQLAFFANNPYYQVQFIIKSAGTSTIQIDNTLADIDSDDPNIGDVALYP